MIKNKRVLSLDLKESIEGADLIETHSPGAATAKAAA